MPIATFQIYHMLSKLHQSIHQLRILPILLVSQTQLTFPVYPLRKQLPVHALKYTKILPTRYILYFTVIRKILYPGTLYLIPLLTKFINQTLILGYRITYLILTPYKLKTIIQQNLYRLSDPVLTQHRKLPPFIAAPPKKITLSVQKQIMVRTRTYLFHPRHIIRKFYRSSTRILALKITENLTHIV